MSRRSDSVAPYFPIKHRFNTDPDIAGLPVSSRYLFLMLVDLCGMERNGGVLTRDQVREVCMSIPRGHAALLPLIARGSVVEEQRSDNGEAVYLLRSAARWRVGLHGDATESKPRTSIKAAERQSSDANVDETRTPRAREEKERKKEREEERTPSGSVRSSSARAAPRSAGGAARPAPMPGVFLGDTVDDDDLEDLTPMRRAEAIAAAKAAIREGQRKGPATGRDATFSRYDPNRKIVPLTSGFKIDGGAE